MSKKILYVEDSPESRLLVRRILEAGGYEIVEAEDGLAAIRLAQQELPDLILMDMHIPGMDGFEVTTRLRSIRALERVPIVALTASAVLDGDRERTLVAGCDGYLQKPVDVDRLPRQIEEFIAGKREVVPQEEQPYYLREYSQKLVTRLQDKIAELEEANERLKTLDRLKSDFVSTVSHELRTPLTSIKGYAQLLLDERAGELSPIQQDSLEVIVDNVELVIRRVNDILFLQESSAIVPALEPISLPDVARMIIGTVQDRAGQAGVEIRTDIAAGPLQLAGDYEALKLLLLHLLDNAIKFSPHGGLVTVRLERRGADIYGEIVDTGIGIEAQYHERIFERFFQVDSSSTRVFGGAGLGLAIAKRIVEAHGGRIGVHSRPGQGTTLFFYLPTHSTPQVRNHPFQE
ncbi:MAG: response regulator [Chloroflexia bacterium]|nr:response regulator [Chloroflexia bacterium]